MVCSVICNAIILVFFNIVDDDVLDNSAGIVACDAVDNDEDKLADKGACEIENTQKGSEDDNV